MGIIIVSLVWLLEMIVWALLAAFAQLPVLGARVIDLQAAVLCREAWHGGPG